jgi:nucleotide-binding universal stress UspA family protein
MHVVVAPEFNPPRPLAETRAEPGSTWLDRQVSAGEDYLCRVAAENGAARAAYKVVVPAVHAADAIAHYCAGHDMDVVVMATHGYPSLARWGGSSVTERVLHATANSVLVVNPPPAGPWLN